MKSNTVFLTWNNSRRSMSICARLGVERVVIVGNRSGLARHILGSLATTVFLIRKRPELIWFQFSLALSVILWVYACVRRTARVQLVADIHTKAMRRSGPIGTRWMIQFLKRRALRRCEPRKLAIRRGILWRICVGASGSSASDAGACDGRGSLAGTCGRCLHMLFR
jgi:hypothetical protein